ncbi:hypothetical protein [Paraburkholderia fungorum]|uniref:hypothetical protein n=1 Tax=Paraburkholderia fungorum TaxID=134537 RepID=UPI00209328BD|nr:hypothetical protein [Paraburkholderia fungorum]USU18813.1 hypothetical protein NFE55_32170 [Paraburkholderia fungorum]USU29191.1 hypothetical protein NFS19_29400 [Paraburkholderia fungorum]
MNNQNITLTISMMNSSITKLQNEASKVTTNSDTRNPIREILPTTSVSSSNVFSDNVWSYRDKSLRGSLDHRCETEIDWDKYRSFMNDSLVHEIKIFTHVCITKYFVLYSKRGVKPKTIIAEVKRFISTMRRFLDLQHIRHFSEITATEWKSLISSTKSKRIISAILKKLSHPIMGDFLPGGSPSLRLEHLRELNTDRSDTNTTIGLPSELFGLLSACSQRVVLVFLNLVNRPASTPDATQILPESEALPHRGNIVDAFDSYKKYTSSARAKKLSQWKRKEFLKNFEAKFGIRLRLFVEYLRLVHGAALSFVALYTGMRASELRLLCNSGLFEKDGHFFIKTTVSKHVPLANAVESDKWIATDALVDAMQCLRILSTVTGSAFLCRPPSTSLAVNEKKLSQTPDLTGLTAVLKNYFRATFSTGPYAEWKLSPQQFREALAEQMALMHVKMPYASMQLKHLAISSQRALRGLPASVTMRYGNYPRTLLSTAVGADAVARVKIRQVGSLFGARRGFAGGGAAQHREKVEAYFAGMGLEGKEREEFIAKIAPHVSVYASGIGFCSLNLLSEREAGAPLCLGDLQCNPGDCSNSVVPAYNRPAIKIRLENCDKALASGDAVDNERLQRLHSAYSSMLEQLDAE